MSGLILIIPLLLIMYLLMIRPQQKRIRAQQEAIRSVEVGDEVVTAAGLIGTIVALDDEVVHLEVADGVEVRVARMAIGRRLAEAGVVTIGDDTQDADADTDHLDHLDEQDEQDEQDEDDEDVDLFGAAAEGEDDHPDADGTGATNGDRPATRGDA